MAPPTTVVIPIRAGRPTMSGETSVSTGNENKPATETAPMESSASTTAGEIEAGNVTVVDAASVPQNQDDPKDNTGETEDPDGEESEEQDGPVSDTISEADEAISAAEAGASTYNPHLSAKVQIGNNAAVRPFFHVQCPFGGAVPDDIKSGAVPFIIDYLAKFLTGGRDGVAGQAYLQLPDHAKAHIAFKAYVPDRRIIRAIWSISHQCWVYNSLRQPNTVPFVVEGFDGAMLRHSMQHFLPAPKLSDFYPYQWFNYEKDTLFLDFTYCARTKEERDEYTKAIRSAVQMLSTHYHENPPQYYLKTLQISYCTEMYNVEDLPGEHTLLAIILGIERTIFVAHEH
jgi:hypothetical protein